MNKYFMAISAIGNLKLLNLGANLAFIVLANTGQAGQLLTARIGYSLPTLNHHETGYFEAYLDEQ